MDASQLNPGFFRDHPTSGGIYIIYCINLKGKESLFKCTDSKSSSNIRDHYIANPNTMHYYHKGNPSKLAKFALFDLSQICKLMTPEHTKLVYFLGRSDLNAKNSPSKNRADDLDLEWGPAVGHVASSTIPFCSWQSLPEHGTAVKHHSK